MDIMNKLKSAVNYGERVHKVSVKADFFRAYTDDRDVKSVLLLRDRAEFSEVEEAAYTDIYLKVPEEEREPFDVVILTGAAMPTEAGWLIMYVAPCRLILTLFDGSEIPFEMYQDTQDRFRLRSISDAFEGEWLGYSVTYLDDGGLAAASKVHDNVILKLSRKDGANYS